MEIANQGMVMERRILGAVPADSPVAPHGGLRLGVRRAQPGGGELAYLGGQRGRVAVQDEPVDLVERLALPLRVERGVRGPEDLLRGGRLGVLVGIEELLVQLL